MSSSPDRVLAHAMRAEWGGKIVPDVSRSLGTFVRWPADLAPLELGGERFVQPRYDGFGLANLAPSILRVLAEAAGTADRLDLSLPPLAPRALPEALTRGVRTVVLVVADGLGHLQLRQELQDGNIPTIGRLLEAAAAGDERTCYTTLTSVFPTTTVAALGSLNSAATPAEHGLLGYTLYLEEFGTVAEMIRWGPLSERGSFADEQHGKHDPQRFFGTETLYQRLAGLGVKRLFAVNPRSFEGTPLTMMLHQGAEHRGYVSTSSISVLVPRLVCESEEPTYVFAYWPTVDSITHVLGPDADEHGEEAAAFDFVLGRMLERLAGCGDTLLLLTADHGHLGTSAEQQVLLNDYQDVMELVEHPPSGERRVTYLHARPGRADALVRHARDRLEPVAVALTREEAIERGLFGPGPLPPRALRRIGDVLLFPRGNLQLAYEMLEPTGAPQRKPPSFCGMHGGLTPEEALIPLLAVRL